MGCVSFNTIAPIYPWLERMLAGGLMHRCRTACLDDLGAPFVAVDLFGAGLHSRVFVSTDGVGARHLVHDESSPIRMFIQGLVDEPKDLEKP